MRSDLFDESTAAMRSPNGGNCLKDVGELVETFLAKKPGFLKKPGFYLLSILSPPAR